MSQIGQSPRRTRGGPDCTLRGSAQSGPSGRGRSSRQHGFALAPPDGAEPLEGAGARLPARPAIAAWSRRTCAAASRRPCRSTKPRAVAAAPPACAAPSSSARPASAGTRSRRPARARSGRRPSCRRSARRPRPRSARGGGTRRSSACADTAWGAGCTASPHTGARTPGWPRSIRGVSSGLPTISPPTTKRPCRCRCSIAAIVALPTVRPCSRCAFLAEALRNARSSSSTFSMPRNT